ncbi:hypothetical protein BIV57_06655 [Mangrovactinospora gilvigrisea]|uniref:Glycosyl hydrolase n=1 Tax=Mangrovactinospora gilvigrisea TaxID=1428644 RepID=A0A1J7C9Y8_9ACTN|nr:hypothetical protein [Mangrovactinospora gilvigrisea]OIV38332.1 hypothetical protein BIV57_06655 [Mangrovactinospora gilvigrisea]
MRAHLTRRRATTTGALLGGALAAALIAAAPGSPAWAATAAHPGPSKFRSVDPLHPAVTKADSGDDDGGEANELAESLNAFDEPRQSPNATVMPGAYTAAWQHALRMPVARAAFHEATTSPYNSDALHYKDQNASNSSGGAGYSAGRMTAVAADPHHPGVVFAAGADGGVFRSTNDGRSWTPISDHLSSLSSGSLAFAPDGSLWVGTGEANTSSDQYLGNGVYRLADPLHGELTQADRVGGTELDSSSVRRLAFSPDTGYAYAATTHGLFRRALRSSTSTAWTKVLAPCVNVGVSGTGCGVDTHYADMANDVVIKPGTHGRQLLANVAWRSGAAYNGFYASDDAGTTWKRITLQGDVDSTAIGNATFAYAADGSKLYMVLESSKTTVLAGVYASPDGSFAGPWHLVADEDTLKADGSAIDDPGSQAWYNQSLAVDPKDPDHVYMGLEEIFETHDGGANWSTIARYWNFGQPCWNEDPAKDTCDGNVTHSDQHALGFSEWPGHTAEVYAGNDGGMYARPVQNAKGWRNLNTSGTLRTLQYYSVGTGALGRSTAIWGGLQDNGVSLLAPRGATYSYTYPGTTSPVTENLNPNGEMTEPFGGDGGDQLVNPKNGCQTVGEYVDLTLQMTNNCGYTANDDGTPGAVTAINPTDAGARFIAPFAADSNDPGFWVAGGEYVWGNSKTWASTSGADWSKLADTGTGHSITAIASRKNPAGAHVVWAAWCGGTGCGPGDDFARGVMTNYGGSFHQLSLPSDVPNRYIAGVTIDPSDATGATAYLTFSGYSRQWNEGPGAGYGHIWRTTDGGATWHDVSGADGARDQLVDAPASKLLIAPDGTLVAATDLGVYTDDVRRDGLGHWKRVGLPNPSADGNLPNSPAVYLNAGPDGRELYVATHGRGIWTVRMP